jgi:hypothetical protein
MKFVKTMNNDGISMPQGITHKNDVFVVLLSLLAETPVVAYREASFHPDPREREREREREEGGREGKKDVYRKIETESGWEEEP